MTLRPRISCPECGSAYAARWRADELVVRPHEWARTGSRGPCPGSGVAVHVDHAWMREAAEKVDAEQGGLGQALSARVPGRPSAPLSPP